MSVSSLQSGCAYSFQYPAHNFYGVNSKLETRRIKVTAIRDVGAEPLDDITLSLNPLLRRGRVLVTGWDLDKDAERSFYADSMIEVERLNRPVQSPSLFFNVFTVGGTLLAEGLPLESARAYCRKWNEVTQDCNERARLRRVWLCDAPSI